ncbi:MAG: 50S ribosomal protein L17, partial [Brevundimonas sp.]|nr:50S ribosomal protein L17 [Brevundimonas sp.]
MRHGAAPRKLGRTTSHRTARFGGLGGALIKDEPINTTL